MPWLHSVTVVMLKFVVIVVIAFAYGQKGEHERVAPLHLVEYGCRPIV